MHEHNVRTASPVLRRARPTVRGPAQGIDLRRPPPPLDPRPGDTPGDALRVGALNGTPPSPDPKPFSENCARN